MSLADETANTGMARVLALASTRWGFATGGIILTLLVWSLALSIMPTGWIVKRVEQSFLSRTGHSLHIDSLDISLMGPGVRVLTPGVSLATPQGVALLDDVQADARLGLLALLRGQVSVKHLRLTKGQAHLTTTTAGLLNWQPIIDAFGPPDPDSSLIESTEIDELVVHAYLADRGVQARLVVSGEGQMFGFDSQLDSEVRGSVNGVRVAGFLRAAPSGRLDPAAGDALGIDSGIRIGENTLKINARLSAEKNWDGSDGRMELFGENLAEVGRVFGLHWLRSENYRLQANATADAEGIDFRFDEVRAGKNKLVARARLEPWQSPRRLTASLDAERLRLDEFIAEAADDMVRDTLEPLPAPAHSPKSTTVSNRLLGSRRPVLAELADRWHWDVDIRLDDIRYKAFQARKLVLSSQLDQRTLNTTLDSSHFAEGSVKARVQQTLDTRPANGLLELDVEQVRLGQVLSTIGIDDAISGPVSSRAKFWVEGDSPAAMASTLDGGLFLVLAGGSLDALYVELAGLDLAESVTTFLRGGLENTTLRCGFLDLQSKDGRIRVGDLVLDSEDTLFIGSGHVDLGDESLDLVIKPHPKDFSFLAAPTGLRISGTLARPKIRPTRSLYTRLATAAALATVATPASVLLAFMDTGGGSDAAQCNELLETLDG